MHEHCRLIPENCFIQNRVTCCGVLISILCQQQQTSKFTWYLAIMTFQRKEIIKWTKWHVRQSLGITGSKRWYQHFNQRDALYGQRVKLFCRCLKCPIESLSRTLGLPFRSTWSVKQCTNIFITSPWHDSYISITFSFSFHKFMLLFPTMLLICLLHVTLLDKSLSYNWYIIHLSNKSATCL